MKQVDEASLTAVLDKHAAQQDWQQNLGLEGVVTTVKGSAGSYQVQVARSGEQQSSGHWYRVEANGTIPVIGDRIRLHRENEQIAIAHTIVSATPRVADAHNIGVSLNWTGSFNTGAGIYNLIGFNNVEGDPSGMFNQGTGLVTLPLSGSYLVDGRAGTTTQNVDVVVGVYLNGSLFRQGTRSTTGTSGAQGEGESLIAFSRRFSAGDTLGLYLFSSGVAALQSGSAVAWFDVYLLGQSSV